MGRERSVDRELAHLRQQLATLERERQELFEWLRAIERERVSLADTLPIAAHQVLGPVQALLLWSDMLKSVAAADAPVSKPWLREHATKMRRTLERVDALMRAAIELWRGQLRDVVPQTESDLATIVRSVVAQHSEEAAHAGATITLKVPAQIIGPWDANKLRFIVAGLVTNAIKHGGGSPIHVEVVDGGTRATLRVSDEGPGFAPDTAAQLFRPFSRQGAGEGFGLGLWIVRELAKALGGSVRARGAPGRGAVFTVTLRKSAHAASARRARRRSRHVRSKEQPR
jgi:signal transduction histidine kinase